MNLKVGDIMNECPYYELECEGRDCCECDLDVNEKEINYQILQDIYHSGNTHAKPIKMEDLICPI